MVPSCAYGAGRNHHHGRRAPPDGCRTALDLKGVKGLRWIVFGLGAALAIAYGTRGLWPPALGRSLVCGETAQRAEAIVLDNIDSEFGLFKRAAGMQPARVIVPLATSEDHDSAVAAREVANAFARAAGLTKWESLEVPLVEPFSLNAARRVRDYLEANDIHSVTLLSGALRSRRSMLIYQSVLGERGITTTCLPVYGTARPDNWTDTWHGIQEVMLQTIKLQYYRFWVLA